MHNLGSAFAVHCGRLFDGNGAPSQTDAVVVVGGGLFRAGPPEPGLPVLDLSRCFVMPGLVDAHAHLSTTPLLTAGWPREPGPIRQALSVPGNLRTNLAAGTTTMRVTGEAGWLDVDARAAGAAGELDGPNLVIATRAVTAAACAELDPDDDTVGVRRIVEENFEHGADFVKIHLTEGADGSRDALFSPAALDAAVDEARRHGTYVSAHAHGGPAVGQAIRAGVRSIEHGFDLSDADIRAMAANGTWLVSTLAFDFSPHGLERVIDRLAPDFVLADLVAQRRVIETRLRSAVAAGVRIAFGSNHLPAAMADEIRLGVRLGMTVAAALTAATSGGAELLGLSHLVGSVAPGRHADLVALRADPFDDLAALDDVVLVMKDGVIHRRTQEATA